MENDNPSKRSDSPLVPSSDFSNNERIRRTSFRKSTSVLSGSLDVENNRDVLELRKRDRSGSFYSEVVEEVVAEEPFGWVIVFAVFMIHVLVDGIPAVFGPLLSSLSTKYEAGAAKISACQSLLFCSTYSCGPVVSYLCEKYGLRPVALAGAVIAATGYFLSIFTDSIWQLSLTYGLLTGIGFGCMYLPAMVSVSSWFEEHRALATSIAVSGNGVGTFALPPLATFFLHQYELSGCMLILSAVILNGLIFAALLRTPPRHRKHLCQPDVIIRKKLTGDESLCKKISHFFHQLDWTLLKNWKFIIFCGSSFLGAVSCFVPSFYLSDRAVKQSFVDDQQASFLFSYLGAASILGRLSAGILSDRKLVNNLFLYSGACIVSGVATGLSVFGQSYLSHAIYAAIYGLSSGIIVALQCVVLAELVGLDMISSAFGILLFVQGTAVLIGPPFAGMIIDYSAGSFTLCFLVVGIIISASGLFLLLIPTWNGLNSCCVRSQVNWFLKALSRPDESSVFMHVELVTKTRVG